METQVKVKTVHRGRVDRAKIKLMVLVVGTTVAFLFILTLHRTDNEIPQPRRKPQQCPLWISKKTFTPLKGTKHLLVSAYMDQRASGFDIRIIGIFRRDSIQALYCLFCCGDNGPASTKTAIFQHSDDFGFPYVTTDVMCTIPKGCPARHVSLLTDREYWKLSEQMWLPVRNLKTEQAADGRYNFTVCISPLFGGYNNVLQVAQSLEMYRLLGVNRVVMYKTSCGPDLDRLLRGYIQEGFVEIVPWPIDEHLTPSYGWLHSQSGGDVHYFGQQTSLNDCIYRSMDRSRYVLLNDIDEIIMPYQHSGLAPLMDMIQQQHPDAGVFLVENHIFPKQYFEPSRKFHLPQWSKVPGVNILEHVKCEDPDRDIYHPHKLIIQPRMVEQTSVHEVLKIYGKQAKVPPDVCHIIHTRVALRRDLTEEELNEDKRLWDFSEKLIPNVDKALRRAGLLDTGDRQE